MGIMYMCMHNLLIQLLCNYEDNYKQNKGFQNSELYVLHKCSLCACISAKMEVLFILLKTTTLKCALSTLTKLALYCVTCLQAKL